MAKWALRPSVGGSGRAPLTVSQQNVVASPKLVARVSKSVAKAKTEKVKNAIKVSKRKLGGPGMTGARPVAVQSVDINK